MSYVQQPFENRAPEYAHGFTQWEKTRAEWSTKMWTDLAQIFDSTIRVNTKVYAPGQTPTAKARRSRTTWGVIGLLGGAALTVALVRLRPKQQALYMTPAIPALIGLVIWAGNCQASKDLDDLNVLATEQDKAANVTYLTHYFRDFLQHTKHEDGGGERALSAADLGKYQIFAQHPIVTKQVDEDAKKAAQLIIVKVAQSYEYALGQYGEDRREIDRQFEQATRPQRATYKRAVAAAEAWGNGAATKRVRIKELKRKKEEVEKQPVARQRHLATNQRELLVGYDRQIAELEGQVAYDMGQAALIVANAKAEYQRTTQGEQAIRQTAYQNTSQALATVRHLIDEEFQRLQREDDLLNAGRVDLDANHYDYTDLYAAASIPPGFQPVPSAPPWEADEKLYPSADSF